MRELAAGSIHSRDTISRRFKDSGSLVRKPGVRKKSSSSGVKYSSDDLYNLIKSKRDSGSTYRKIAQDLNAKMVIRHNGSINWHPMMIKRVLEK